MSKSRSKLRRVLSPAGFWVVAVALIDKRHLNISIKTVEHMAMGTSCALTPSKARTLAAYLCEVADIVEGKDADGKSG